MKNRREYKQTKMVNFEDGSYITIEKSSDGTIKIFTDQDTLSKQKVDSELHPIVSVRSFNFPE